MKTGNRHFLAKLALFLIIPATLVFAEVTSGFWLLMDPTADSLTMIDFSDLVSSGSSPIYRNTTYDTGVADCFLRNGNIIAPGGVFYDTVLSARCDSVITGKRFGLSYTNHFYLDSMMKRLQLSVPSGVFTDSIVTPPSCRVFFVKTRENHTAVLFRVGETVGGINRIWFYWAYRSDGAAELFKQQLCELPDPRQLKIVMDVFSGRPNPEFIVDDSATVASITHAAFAYINTLFDTTVQTVGMLECPNTLAYRGLSVSGAFPHVDNSYSDYLPTFVICAGTVALQHAEPWKSSISPLMAKDRDSRLEKIIIAYGCERNLTVTDEYGTLQFCDLVPDSLKPVQVPTIGPVRRTTPAIQKAVPAMSINGKTVSISGMRNVRTIDVFNLAGKRIHSVDCSGRETASFLMPPINNRCILISLRFTDGSRSQIRKVALR